MENDNLERPNFLGFLPAGVRYAKITPSAKLLYIEVSALANKTGTCWASNKYFADLYRTSTKTISRLINELVDAGFIESDVVKSAGNRRYLRLSSKMFIGMDKNEDTYGQKRHFSNREADTSANVLKESNNINRESLNKDLLILVNKVLGREFRVLPERGVKKTLDAFSLVEIEMALTALARDSWHASKLKELKLDYFIRSTTIDKFLAIAKKDGVVPADEGVEDPIIARGDGTFPAKWPEGKPEYRTDYGADNDREDRYFRDVKIDHKTLPEYQRIMAERG